MGYPALAVQPEYAGACSAFAAAVAVAAEVAVASAAVAASGELPRQRPRQPDSEDSACSELALRRAPCFLPWIQSSASQHSDWLLVVAGVLVVEKAGDPVEPGFEPGWDSYLVWVVVVAVVEGN